MSITRNIEPLGGNEAIRSPMLAQAFAMLSNLPADYLAAMLPVLSTYVPSPAPVRAQREQRRRELTIHWGKGGAR
ncbi:MAG: hypothetical protein NT031_09710 [Planctomycetota bacterium]|nr:hypothetical protein [Planctomycetota bacterium]